MSTTHQKWLRSWLGRATLLVLLGTTSAAGYVPAAVAAHNAGPAVLAAAPACAKPSSWELAPGPDVSRMETAGVAADGHLFVLGGWDHYVSGIASVESAPIGADGTLGAWITTIPLTDTREDFGAVAVNDYLYVIGGFRLWQGSLAEVERAPILAGGQLGAWEAQEPLPAQSDRTYLAAVTTGTHIYVLGGQNTAYIDVSHDVLEAAVHADGSLGPWVSTSPMLIGRQGFGAVISGSFMYVLGGDDENKPGAGHSVERADIHADGSLGAWQEMLPLQIARSAFAALAADGYLYAIGGAPTTSTVERAAIHADGSLGAWEFVDPLNTGRESYAAASFNGHFYIVDGSSWIHDTPLDALDTVEYVKTSDLSVAGDDGLTINDGALFTNQTAVSLTISGKPGTTQMQISNDGGFAGAAWQDCVASIPWTITQYGNSQIGRVVYAKFKDADGVVSGIYSDDIILDVTPPTGTVQITPMAPAVSRPALTRDLPHKLYLPLVTSNFCAPVGCPPNVLLHFSVSDDASGVGSMEIGNDPAFTGRQWEPYGPSKPWYLPAGLSTVYARFRDNAGNVSKVVSATLAL